MVGIRRALGKTDVKSEPGLKMNDYLLSQISTRLSSFENYFNFQMSAFLYLWFKSCLFNSQHK
ncbi:UNVERIFIED_CONTAM: hypothetical protein FKN15_062429 [Acipenser sinensis]